MSNLPTFKKIMSPAEMDEMAKNAKYVSAIKMYQNSDMYNVIITSNDKPSYFLYWLNDEKQWEYSDTPEKQELMTKMFNDAIQAYKVFIKY